MYIFKIIIISGLLYLFYCFLLRKTTLFKLNRIYLLISFILPLVLPLIDIPVNNNSFEYSLPVMLNEIRIGENEYAPEATPVYKFSFILWIYIIVSIIFIIKILRGLISIANIYNKSEKLNYKNFNIVVSNYNTNVFSFFNLIFINKDQLENKNDLSQIITHENTHISQFHTIDNILSEIICAVFWINPIFWLIRNDLKITHEFQADERVIRKGFDYATYFTLLYKNTIQPQTHLTNNLNQSLTLKRLKMMKRKRSSRYLRWFYLAVTPLFLCIIFTFTCLNLNAIESIDNTEIVNPDFGNDTIFNNAEVDIKPGFVGGDIAIMEYILKNTVYPPEAKEKGIKGQVFVSFVIEENGKISQVKIAKGVDPLLDDEALKVVSSMPDWIPAKKDGKNVKTNMIFPINFTLKDE